MVIAMAIAGLLTIGTLAKQSGVKLETIRYYEKVGLLLEPRRTAAGYRQYSRDAAARLRFIRRARELGFSVSEVRDLLGLADQRSRSCRRVHEIASAHLGEVRGKLADLRRLERLLTKTVGLCARGTMPDCPLLTALAH